MRKPKRIVRTRTKTATPKTKTNRKRTRKEDVPSRRGFERGAAGFKKAAVKRERQEEDYQRRINTPFGFRLKPGDEAEVVILDDQEPFFVSLHKIKTPQGRWEDEVCIADTGERCPLCESTGKEGSYTMILTVLDRRPYKARSGKVIKASKKLFFVKGRNLPKFQRQYERHEGNWRGMRVLCRRDGDKEAAIGEDLEFLGKVSEAKLAKFKDLAVPADYATIFAIPTAKELAKRHNIGSSNVAGAVEFGGADDDDYDLDDVGWD